MSVVFLFETRGLSDRVNFCFCFCFVSLCFASPPVFVSSCFCKSSIVFFLSFVCSSKLGIRQNCLHCSSQQVAWLFSFLHFSCCFDKTFPLEARGNSYQVSSCFFFPSSYSSSASSEHPASLVSAVGVSVENSAFGKRRTARASRII